MINGNPASTEKSTIYAATHVFFDDAAVVTCCLKQPTCRLMGIEGPDNTPSFIERFAIWLNGIIIVNRCDKRDTLSLKGERDGFVTVDGDAVRVARFKR